MADPLLAIFVIFLLGLIVAALIAAATSSGGGGVTQTVHVHGNPQQPSGVAPEMLHHMLEQSERRHGEQMRALMHQPPPQYLPPPGMHPEQARFMQEERDRAFRIELERERQQFALHLEHDRRVAHERQMQIDHQNRIEHQRTMAFLIDRDRHAAMSAHAPHGAPVIDATYVNRGQISTPPQKALAKPSSWVKALIKG